MKSILAAGQTRFYEEEGEGPPVILVHGSLSNARQWRTLKERLRGRFRVLAPDLSARANGAGIAADGTCSFEEDCALVARLLEQAGGKAHLLGHSYGGIVAIKAAFAQRDAIASLILIEPSCFHLLEQERQPEFSEITALLLAQRDSAARGDMEASAQGFIDYWIAPGAFAAMPESRRKMIALGIPKVAKDWRGTNDHQTTLADYLSFGVPTLVMRARDTRAPSFRIADMIAGVLPDVSRAEIASGGHMSPLTNPEPVNDAVETFLRERGWPPPQGE